MGEFGNISWDAKIAPDTAPSHFAPTKSFDSFLRYCEAKTPNIPLSKSYKEIEKQKNRLSDIHKSVIESIAKEPVLASFIVWVKEIEHAAPGIIEGAKMLLEHGFIGTVDTQGALWTIQKARGFDQTQIVEAIRCQRQLPITTRESLVSTYINFIRWLCCITYGYINPLEDPDHHRSLGKFMAYSNFIRFLDALENEKAQLVAKLLYFGKNRTLEEVLSLDITQVHFKKKKIQFDSQLSEYPEHVFCDIKAITYPRKTGRVFEGRQKAALNPKTIFRNFKEAAELTKLGPSFSVKWLTTNE